MVRGVVTRVLAMLSAAAGCTSEGAPSDAGADACPLEVAVGYGEDEGTFVPLADGDDAEIVQGFQGFLFLELTVRLRGTDAAEARVTVQADVEGQDTSWVNRVVSLEGTGETRYGPELQVFFNAGSRAELLHRQGTFAFGVSAGGCVGNQDLELRLVDEDACIHQGDGGLVCADGG